MYVVGTSNRTDDEAGHGPTGTRHAVRIEEAYDGIAICGAEVNAWPDIDFPTGRPRRDCEVCQRAVDFEN